MRPPVVAIVGHIDHGKSTLLDYIRAANVVGGEAGGITQHLSAYEAEHKNSSGTHRITFLDTPGHAAFAGMRSRGLEVADVAILVVSAEEGVKPQTLETLKLIEGVKIPYIVAFTKIDKEGANIERAKHSLLEHQVFLEGLGGEVPWVAVSGKTGEGIPELLDLILLAGEIEGLNANPASPGKGLVIEAHVDGRRGNTATLIVADGTVKSGQYIVAGEALAPVRIMENFLGKSIKEALPGQPVVIVGFSTLPAVGTQWKTVKNKKEAESEAAQTRTNNQLSKEAAPQHTEVPSQGEDVGEKLHLIVPLVIKTDVAGVGEAVMHELEKLPKDERLEVRIVSQGVGPISETDVRAAGAGSVPGIIAGFNVKVDREAQNLAERLGVKVQIFDIIYKLVEWLEGEVKERRPLLSSEMQKSSAKILKVFSTAKGRVVLGGRVEEGSLTQGAQVKVMRHLPAQAGDEEVGRGSIVSLQTQKRDVTEVESGSEFGAMIKLSNEPAAGDMLIQFEVEMN